MNKIKVNFKPVLLLVLSLILLFAANASAYNRVQLSPDYLPNPTRSRALSSADIYVGEPDLDPEIVANQKTLSVQQEDGTIVVVAQPISTSSGGVPQYLGSPVTLLVDGDYSLKILDSHGSQIYYVPNVAYNIPKNFGGFLSDYGCDLAAAVADIGAVDQMILNVDCDCVIASGTTVTVTDNITLDFINGGSIDGVAGGLDETIVIEAPIQAGKYQVYGENVTVLGSSDIINATAYPEWWGAKPDGLDASATLNGNAITKTVAYLNSCDGGHLKFGTGTYMWGGDISYPYNIKISGNGVDSTILKLYDDGELIDTTINGKFRLLSADTGDGNIVIEDITFNNDAFIPTNQIRILWVGEKENITIRNCKFICRAFPFLINQCDNVRIINNTLINSPDYDGVPAIPIEECDNVDITGNICEAATLLAADGNGQCSLNLRGNKNLTATNNKVYGSYAAGILIEGVAADIQLADKNVIANNIIDLSGFTEDGRAVSGILIQKCLNAEIYNNRIVGQKLNAGNYGINIMVNVDNDEVLKIIHSNKIYGFKRGIYVSDSSGYEYLNNLSIKDNIIENMDDYGIYLLANNQTVDKDYHIVIDGNEFYDSPSIKTNITSHAGTMVVTNNILGVGSGSIDIRTGCPPLTLGGNNNAAIAGTTPLFINGMTALPLADWQTIQFLEKKTWESDPIDLSGAAVSITCHLSQNPRLLLKAKLIYTEATSADAGVTVVVQYTGALGTGAIIENITTEINKTIYTATTVEGPDLGTAKYQVYSGRPWYNISCAGGKVGTGEVVVQLEWIETYGALL